MLDTRTAPSSLVEEDGERLVCVACAHGCALRDGERGICGVRARSGGELRVPWGYVARKYVRPVEINTLYHVLPGSRSLTFGNFGCDLACSYCQNAYISQAVRDGRDAEQPIDITPEALVEEAAVSGCEVVCAAYNEPMVSVEWVRAIFERAKDRGLITAVITDGHSTAQAMGYLRPVLDVFRVDVKASGAAAYRSLGGDEAAVWSSIERARALGLWVEIVTLVVPGLNDDPQTLRTIAGRVAAVDPAIPWHVNGFVPRYRMRDAPATPRGALIDAAGIGYGAGLRFVYASNVTGLAALGATRCPRCHDTLLERDDYQLKRRAMTGDHCRCGEPIPGLWSHPPRGES